MILPQKNEVIQSTVSALYDASECAAENGTADMTLDEINAEITAVRAAKVHSKD